MEKGRIAMAALDPNTNSVGYHLRGEQGENWCRLYNECTKELLKKYPHRFTAMAAVPMQEPARAAKVLEHAIVELKFCGAFIASNVNHRYYDSKEFDPFWAKAQELDVLIVMHPEDVAGSELMGSYGLRLVCGNPADSTLSLGFLIYSGVFDRFPNLKLCSFHGGGFLPYHLGRFDQEFVTGRYAGRRLDRPHGPQCASRPSDYLKNLYFDTLVYDVDTLDYLMKKVGSDRLLVGTDFPYALGDWMAVDKVEALNCSAAEKEAILEGNARRLLRL
jgi:aminocarboxymuconate-semialdehyde decarboxylase